MNICNLENIEKSYGDKILLKNVTLGIDSTDKIGVIGVNGTGKTFAHMFHSIILV